MSLLSAFPLEQVRRTTGLPRSVPLTAVAEGLVGAIRRIDPAQLDARERAETERVLSGLASAFRYERLRSSGVVFVEGWDPRSAPQTPELADEYNYRLRYAAGGVSTYVSEPSALEAEEIAALHH